MASTKSPTSSWSESPDTNGGQIVRLDLDHRDVDIGIAADPRFAGSIAAVGERHRDLVGVLDDVIVGEDKALIGVKNHAGAGRA